MIGQNKKLPPDPPPKMFTVVRSENGFLKEG